MKIATKSMVFALLAALALLLPACAEEVGYPCTLKSGPDSGVGVQVLSQATDCRSRLCIYVVGDSEAKPLCTRICKSDDDCPKFDKNREHLCPTDFVCVVGMTSGALKCCKMCVCKKYLPDLATYNKNMQQTCAGITPNCPKL